MNREVIKPVGTATENGRDRRDGSRSAVFMNFAATREEQFGAPELFAPLGIPFPSRGRIALRQTTKPITSPPMPGPAFHGRIVRKAR